MVTSLDSLPPELISNIVSNLSNHSLTVLARVNRLLNEIALNRLYEVIILSEERQARALEACLKLHHEKKTRPVKVLIFHPAVGHNIPFFEMEALDLKDLKVLNLCTLNVPNCLSILPLLRLEVLVVNFPWVPHDFERFIAMFRQSQCLVHLILKNTGPSMLDHFSEATFGEFSFPLLKRLEIHYSSVNLIPFISTCTQLTHLHLAYQSHSPEPLLNALPNPLVTFEFLSGLPFQKKYGNMIRTILNGKSKALSDLKVLHLSGSELDITRDGRTDILDFCRKRKIEIQYGLRARN